MGEQTIILPGKWLTQFMVSPRYRIIRHILLFSVTLFICVQTIYIELPRSANHWPNVLFLAVFTLPVYLNIFYLVPRLLYRNKVWSYLAGIMVTLILSLLLALLSQYLSQRYLIEISDHHHLFVTINLISGMISIVLLSFGITAIMLFQERIRYGITIQELEKETIRTELEQLKNQVNPHFLFNMLNNANVLVHENRQEARRVLEKLKDLLQYQFDDGTKKEVRLLDEIQFLTDYLNLEKVRRDSFKYQINTRFNTNIHFNVPPLLFIPFVENAVKHGNDARRQSSVIVDFRVTDNRLHFQCINTKPVPNRKKQAGGLGLANIRRRLELLYADNYNLDITESEEMFTVNLELVL